MALKTSSNWTMTAQRASTRVPSNPAESSSAIVPGFSRKKPLKNFSRCFFGNFLQCFSRFLQDLFKGCFINTWKEFNEEFTSRAPSEVASGIFQKFKKIKFIFEDFFGSSFNNSSRNPSKNPSVSSGTLQRVSENFSNTSFGHGSRSSIGNSLSSSFKYFSKRFFFQEFFRSSYGNFLRSLEEHLDKFSTELLEEFPRTVLKEFLKTPLLGLPKKTTWEILDGTPGKFSEVDPREILENALEFTL